VDAESWPISALFRVAFPRFFGLEATGVPVLGPTASSEGLEEPAW
jgi:hypothetical protein